MYRTPLLIAALVAAPAALAQPAAPTLATLAARANDAAAVMQGKAAPDAVFTPEFLAEVPPAQIKILADQLAAQSGALSGAEAVEQTGPGSAKFVLLYERARAAAVLRLEDAAPFRIAGLRITEVTPIGDNPDKIAADVAALHGRAGFALVKLGPKGAEPILTSRPDDQFAIGSAFKLWVLDALAQDVAIGKRHWGDVVTLGLRSLPSGQLQNWPSDAAVTLETLATLMISNSDNTATDTLIRVLGRDAVAARVRASGHSAPERMLPFLTTLEAFTLKARGSGEAYGKADEAGQAAQLARLAPTLSPKGIDPAAFAGGKPQAIDSVEWFASAKDLVGVLNGLRQRKDPKVMAILGVNPAMGPAVRARFARVGFKGGSEPGVLNLSHVIEGKDGSWYALAISWNDPAAPVDTPTLLGLSARLLTLIP